MFELSSFPVVISPTLSGLNIDANELPDPISAAPSVILFGNLFQIKDRLF